MAKNPNEFMNLKFYVRLFKDGKWRSVDITEMTEEEFRRYLCWKIGLVGLKKEGC